MPRQIYPIVIVEVQVLGFSVKDPRGSSEKSFRQLTDQTVADLPPSQIFEAEAMGFSSKDPRDSGEKCFRRLAIQAEADLPPPRNFWSASDGLFLEEGQRRKNVSDGLQTKPRQIYPHRSYF